MVKQRHFWKYVKIIQFFQNGKYGNFKELKLYLDREYQLTEKEDLDYKIRSFQRDKLDIEQLFGIVIKYSRAGNYYYIAENMLGEVNNRFVEVFDLYNSLNFHSSMDRYVQMENRCQKGSEHMEALLLAAQRRQIVKFTYIKHTDESVSHRSTEPILLKEFKGRWYLIAYDRDKAALRTFGLDRICDLELTKVKFQDRGIDPKKHFADTFGIVHTDEPAREIILAFTPKQGRYLKAYPIHESQEVIQDDDHQFKVRLHMKITYDFVKELLWHGQYLRIESPRELKEQYLETLRQALENNTE